MTQAEATEIIHRHYTEDMVKRLKQQAADRLKDPESARFRRLTLYNDRVAGVPEDVEEGNYTLCGEVNAKNSMGGYVGYEPFFSTVFIIGGTSKADPKSSDVWFDDPDDRIVHKTFSDLSAKFCQGKGETIDTSQ